MFFDYSDYTYFVCPGFTDMRRGSDSLAQLVISQMNLNPMSKSMFLFCSKNKKILAILVWDNGFWIMRKKIYKGTFVWVQNQAQALSLTVEDIRRLITGEDVFRRIPVLSDDVQI